MTAEKFHATGFRSKSSRFCTISARLSDAKDLCGRILVAGVLVYHPSPTARCMTVVRCESWICWRFLYCERSQRDWQRGPLSGGFQFSRFSNTTVSSRKKDREHPQLLPVHIKTEIAEMQQIFAHLDITLYRYVAARPAWNFHPCFKRLNWAREFFFSKRKHLFDRLRIGPSNTRNHRFFPQLETRWANQNWFFKLRTRCEVNAGFSVQALGLSLHPYSLRFHKRSPPSHRPKPGPWFGTLLLRPTAKIQNWDSLEALSSDASGYLWIESPKRGPSAQSMLPGPQRAVGLLKPAQR